MTTSMETDASKAHTDSEGNELGKLFIGGLAQETDNDALRNYFNRYGEIEEAVVMMDNRTRRSRGFGYVKFKNHDSVKFVLSQGKHVINCKEVDAKFCNINMKGRNRRSLKVFLGGIAPESNEEDIRKAMSEHGGVTDVTLMMDQAKHRHRGFAYVGFSSEKAVKDLINMRYINIGNKQVEVKAMEPPRFGPRQPPYGMPPPMGMPPPAVGRGVGRGHRMPGPPPPPPHCPPGPGGDWSGPPPPGGPWSQNQGWSGGPGPWANQGPPPPQWWSPSANGGASAGGAPGGTQGGWEQPNNHAHWNHWTPGPPPPQPGGAAGGWDQSASGPWGPRMMDQSGGHQNSGPPPSTGGPPPPPPAGQWNGAPGGWDTQGGGMSGGWGSAGAPPGPPPANRGGPPGPPTGPPPAQQGYQGYQGPDWRGGGGGMTSSGPMGHGYHPYKRA